MCALAPPILLSHVLEQLRGGRARAAKRIEGGRDFAIVIIQTPGVGVLIVALNQRMIFDQQPSQTETAGRFTVSEMMNYFCRAPLAGERMRSQRLGGKTFQTPANFVCNLLCSGRLILVFPEKS
jgi:hypothetical protein